MNFEHDIKDLNFADEKLRLSRKVTALKGETLPAKLTNRPMWQKIVSHGKEGNGPIKSVPHYLAHMSSHSDQLANAVQGKQKAGQPEALQIQSLAAHEKSLLADAEKAKAKGNVRKVAALVDKIEANRKQMQKLADHMIDRGHELVCFIEPGEKFPAYPVKANQSYTVATTAMPEGDKHIPLGKPIPDKMVSGKSRKTDKGKTFAALIARNGDLCPVYEMVIVDRLEASIKPATVYASRNTKPYKPYAGEHSELPVARETLRFHGMAAPSVTVPKTVKKWTGPKA